MEMNTLAIYGPCAVNLKILWRMNDLQPRNHPILESSWVWKLERSTIRLDAVPIENEEILFPSSPGSWLDPFSPQNVDAHPVCSAELNRENFPSSIFPSQPQPSISLCKCFTCSGLDSKGWRAACKVRRLGSKDSLFDEIRSGASLHIAYRSSRSRCSMNNRSSTKSPIHWAWLPGRDWRD